MFLVWALGFLLVASEVEAQGYYLMMVDAIFSSIHDNASKNIDIIVADEAVI